jgi:hypothetical protein
MPRVPSRRRTHRSIWPGRSLVALRTPDGRPEPFDGSSCDRDAVRVVSPTARPPDVLAPMICAHDLARSAYSQGARDQGRSVRPAPRHHGVGNCTHESVQESGRTGISRNRTASPASTTIGVSATTTTTTSSSLRRALGASFPRRRDASESTAADYWAERAESARPDEPSTALVCTKRRDDRVLQHPVTTADGRTSRPSDAPMGCQGAPDCWRTSDGPLGVEGELLSGHGFPVVARWGRWAGRSFEGQPVGVRQISGQAHRSRSQARGRCR